jgi:predicted metal-dependent phosphoesterase TrpH
MLKVELHTHTADDPVDAITHTATDLIDRAAELQYDALAITLHERQLDIRPLIPYAAERAIVLIPGLERTIEGRHVLLLNFDPSAEEVSTFDDLARLKRRSSGIVIAPHAFFPSTTCLRKYLDRYPDLFDVIEYNAMYTASLNFNDRAVEWAARHGKPMVGNCDVHCLYQLGTCYSLVDSEPHPDAICNAIAAGRVRVESQPITWARAVRAVVEMNVAQLLPRHWVQPQPAAALNTAAPVAGDVQVGRARAEAGPLRSFETSSND